MKVNPTRSAIVWIDIETLTLMFRNVFKLSSSFKLKLHLNELAKRCTFLSGKCQMFINVIRAPLKDFDWFPDFVISVSVIKEIRYSQELAKRNADREA